ncbi:MAG: class I SAM-dependent methyltransferase [Nocardioidaceae bacterium]
MLDDYFPDWEGREIHESSPSNDFIRRHAARYTASQLFPNVARGKYRGKVRSEDLEALTLPESSVDIFITQDVLEHVFHPDRALREIHRVLRPGGVHVFTTPKHHTLAETVQRASSGADGSIEYLLERQYHGNPIGDNRALVTFDFGVDFEERLRSWLGEAALVATIATVDLGRGIDAEHNEVFVVRKPEDRSSAQTSATVLPRRTAAAAGNWARNTARRSPFLRRVYHGVRSRLRPNA